MVKAMKWMFFLFPFFLCAESPSFYQGYFFYKDHAAKLDLEESIKGMKSAYQGVELDKKEIQQKQQELYEQNKANNLVEAQQFLAKIAIEEGVIEVVKDKLYIKKLRQGDGLEITETDSPSLLYTAKILMSNKEEELYAIKEPKSILLQSTIPGFLKGIVGMKEGEKRILYIHPDLAYGTASSKVKPNTLMIFEVELIKAHP